MWQSLGLPKELSHPRALRDKLVAPEFVVADVRKLGPCFRLLRPWLTRRVEPRHMSSARGVVPLSLRALGRLYEDFMS
jgi:hypothetical protein